MRRILTGLLCGMLAIPPPSLADDDHHGSRPPPAQGDWRAAPPAYQARPPGRDHDDHGRYKGNDRYYGNVWKYAKNAPHYYAPYPYYSYGYKKHHHDSDNDDVWWAIGGLVVGAAIATAAQQSLTPTSTAGGRSCYDAVVYDAAGNPRVQRQCN